MTTKQLLLSFLLAACIFVAGLQKTYAHEIAIRSVVIITDSIAFKCSKNDEIAKIIVDAIDIGAPVYNAGNYIGCYRIYDATAYKILYLYGDKCSEITKILKDCIEKCHVDYSDTEKAWIMRGGFDKILGEPTVTGAPTNSL